MLNLQINVKNLQIKVKLADKCLIKLADKC